MSDTNAEGDRLIVLVADIVSAYVSNNHIQGSDLPKLLGDVYEAMLSISSGAEKTAGGASQAVSTQDIKRSISHEYLISFEDGKPYKTLRRHLTLRGLSPEQYRAKWGLPLDYPMTSAGYSEQRSELARALGLGQQRRKITMPIAELDTQPDIVETNSEQPVPVERRRRAPQKKLN